jgi:DNA invertase Pin-like site-specific DNA recombinase
MNKMRFVSYFRVSTKSQGIEGNGMEGQRLAVSRYLASLDCELIGTFQEVESGKINNRPELSKAIALAKKSKAILVIAKLDRLSRNAAFLLQLQDSGVDFVACDMPNADKFSVGILALMAQRERELISQRTKTGLAVVKARGTKLGNPNPKASLKKAVRANIQRKREFAGAAIKIIREIQSTGVETLAHIAECMNKRGEKTPRCGRWTATAVKRVLDITF